jgi:hypothetical protein
MGIGRCDGEEPCPKPPGASSASQWPNFLNHGAAKSARECDRQATQRKILLLRIGGVERYIRALQATTPRQSPQQIV